jgi:PAS domain S-box-containing protein
MTVMAPPASRSRILVVDDELGPRESLRMLLKPLYDIRTSDSARAALQEIPEYRPDLVILDIKMPEMDGLEVLRRIKRLDAAIEVVMITAYASLETVKQALSYGAFEYLIKPFSRQDLEDVVRRALRRRHADLGQRGQIAGLVTEMRSLAAKTRELEEAARREAAEQSLRVTQLSILREIARAIVGQLDLQQLTEGVTGQLRRALGYDAVVIMPETEAPPASDGEYLITCQIRDAEGPLGHLVVDNRASGRAVDPRERELLEMLSEYLAVAVRNSRLYMEIASTKRSLEQLIASAGDGIIAIDAGDRIEGWNPAAERVFGLTTAEATGRPITDVLPAVDYAGARSRLIAGAAMDAFEVAFPLEGGRARSLAVTLSALRGRDNAIDGLIAIVRDITVQREVEAQLNQSEKLTALGQLAGGIAHDFNNLLQAILGYAQLMKQNLGDAQLVTRSLRVLESAAIDGSETVRRIQQFARLRPDEQFVSVDVNRIVEDAVAIIRPRWEEKVSQENRPMDLQLQLGPVAAINGRPAALTEVMTNLILNAIDAMPYGGRLTIATGQGQRQSVVITVTDTGVGMQEAVRRRIFEPFFSTKGESGSGLGLAMVFSIVKRHGGDIRVDSQPGRGTRFTMTFPSAAQPTATAVESPLTGPRRAARVLVVDDDAQVLDTLAALLRSLGHTVKAVTSGIDALEAHAPGRFEVILSNMGMAGMNGWEVAERVRDADPSVAIMFITGWGLKEEDNARLTSLGISRCLFKPVRPDELDAAIQAVLR